MAGLRRKLLEVARLCTAIALAKGMDVVHIANDDAGLPCELVRAQSFQEFGLHQPAMNVVHAGLDVASKLELVAALIDLDGAQLACPIIDVLEEVAMDCAKMVEIKQTVRHATS